VLTLLGWHEVGIGDTCKHAKPPVENRAFAPVVTDGLSRVPLPEHQRGLTVFTSLAWSPRALYAEAPLHCAAR